MVLNLVQQMKVATSKLSDEAKKKAFDLLEKAGIAEYKKQDYSSQTQAVFTELLNIHNKSEKLHEKAKLLFNKDKSYSPKTIESMATGESNPSKWLITCAIDLLIDEQVNLLKTLTEDDIFMLWAKQLLDSGCNRDPLLTKIQVMNMDDVNSKIIHYTPKSA